MKYTTLITASALTIAIFVQPAAWSAKLYKWVDENGNISYQDSPPPEGSTLIKEEEITPKSPPASEQSQSTVVFRQQPVIVYTIPNCPACDSLLEQLQGWNIPVSEQSLQDRAVQARILQESDSLSAPTLYIGDNIISNQSEENLKSELQNSGYQITSTEETESETETESDAETEG